jgi:hypothetical protein
LGGLQAGLEAVGESEKGFDAADDFGLLSQRRDRQVKGTTLRK